MATIEVQQLRKTYAGDIHAVRDIEFAVDSGEVFGLLGPNGAGKSTTIGMLTTTIAPTAGRAILEGFDVATHALAARHVSGVVFQEAVVDRTLSGRRNLEIHGRLWGVERARLRTRIDEVTASLGVDGIVDRAVSTYSGGQRRRLEIARALLSEPRILFLDEPTVGLDPRIRYELLDVIATLRERINVTILLTTHYLDEAERLCDRVAIMHEGAIVATGAPGALCAALGQEIVEVRVDGDGGRALAVLRERGAAGPDALALGSTITLPVADRAAATAVISAIDSLALDTHAVTTRRITLDDVYLRLTGSPIHDALNQL